MLSDYESVLRSIEAGALLPNVVGLGFDKCRLANNSRLPVDGSRTGNSCLPRAPERSEHGCMHRP